MTEPEAIDKEILVTFCLEDVPGKNPPETVYYLVPYQMNQHGPSENVGLNHAEMPNEVNQVEPTESKVEQAS